MTVSPKSTTAWIWLLLIALLVVRLGGTHWHLCFDGSEPPMSIHSGHLVPEESGAPIEQHTDLDLLPLDNVLGKNIAKLFDLPLLLIAVFICLLLPRRTAAPTGPLCYSPLSRYRLTSHARAPPR